MDITRRGHYVGEGEPEKFCDKCAQSLPLTEDFWHKDSHSPDGFHANCINCRKVAAQKESEKQTRQMIEKFDTDLLRSIKNSISDSDYRGVAQASELYEEVIRAFGGPKGFANHYAATYLSASPTVREKMLRTMANMGLRLEMANKTNKSVGDMTDQEIAEEVGRVYLRLHKEEELEVEVDVRAS